MSIHIGVSDNDRRGYCLSTELTVAESRPRVFEFFCDAYQLEALTPSWLHFSVLTPRPIPMQAGTIIDYRLRIHGWPIRWRSRISVWNPPEEFVDEQLRGPYRHWHHLHTFQEVPEGTRMRDIVHYSVPLGVIVHPLLVRRDLMRIFEYRRQVIGRTFRSVPDPASNDTKRR